MASLKEFEAYVSSDAGFYYLAGPCEHKNPEVVKTRIRSFERMDARLSMMGYLVYSPLDKFYKAGLEHHADTYAYWERYCKSLLAITKGGLIVIMEDGWLESKGVWGEIQEARRLGLTIYFLDPLNE